MLTSKVRLEPPPPASTQVAMRPPLGTDLSTWLAGYQPSEMKIGAIKRLGGRMFRANVAFDDHPDELRFSDRIRTVTVDSMQNFLLARKEGWTIFELKASR